MAHGSPQTVQTLLGLSGCAWRFRRHSVDAQRALGAAGAVGDCRVRAAVASGGLQPRSGDRRLRRELGASAACSQPTTTGDRTLRPVHQAFSKLFTESQVFSKRNRLPSCSVKNFFKGISFSSIFAGALAAVTSFLLSRENRHRGIGDWCRRRFHRLGRCARRCTRTCSRRRGRSCKNAVPFVANDKDGTDGAGKSGDDATTVIVLPPNPRASRPRRCPRRNPMRRRSLTSVDGNTTDGDARNVRPCHLLRAGRRTRIEHASGQCRSEIDCPARWTPGVV